MKEKKKKSFSSLAQDRDYRTYRRINDTPVKQVLVSKSLSVKIDQNLNWENHLQMISKNVASGISAMKRVRNCSS